VRSNCCFTKDANGWITQHARRPTDAL